VKGDLRRHRSGGRDAGQGRAPILYTGGGMINSGPRASELLRELQD
jgi:acetolactate synthase I/II/III large subunit